jgi:hypothetical protein
MDPVTLITSTAVSAALSAVVVFLARAWISERLQQSIRHEYNLLLEQYKHQLTAEHELALERLRTANAQNQMIQATAAASFAEGHRAAHERRLSAVTALWDETLRVRKITPAFINVLDMFDMESRGELLATDSFSSLVNSVTVESLAKDFIHTGSDVERARPFVGEYVYSLFYAYRAIPARIVLITQRSIGKEKPADWMNDPSLHDLIANVLTSEEVAELAPMRKEQFSWLRTRLEAKLLERMARLISGQDSGDVGVEQAHRIAQAVQRMSGDAQRGAKAG